jgi:hypothetical protein
MVGHHAGNLPRPHRRGDPCAPAPSRAPSHPTGTWRWTSVLGRPGDKRSAPASARAKRRAGSAVATRASHALPTHDHPFPAGPDSGSDDQAAHRPRRHVAPGCAQRGRSRGTDAFREPARCGQRGCSGRGHRTPVCPDTRITPVAWTPVAWTPDVRATSWTDVCPHGGQRMRTERRTAWPVSGHPGRPRGRRPPAGRRKPRSGCSVCGARQLCRRLHHDRCMRETPFGNLGLRLPCRGRGCGWRCGWLRRRAGRG